MSARATEATVFTVFRQTQEILKSASEACTRAVDNIDAASMDFGNLKNGLMAQLIGVINNMDDPGDWGAGFITNINEKAVDELNQANWDVEVDAARTAIQLVMTNASALFPRNGSNKVIYEEITPSGSTYDTPADLTGLRADLIDAIAKIG